MDARTGQPVTLTFDLVDACAGVAAVGVADAVVVSFFRDRAAVAIEGAVVREQLDAAGDGIGIYYLTFTPPLPGLYLVTVEWAGERRTLTVNVRLAGALPPEAIGERIAGILSVEELRLDFIGDLPDLAAAFRPLVEVDGDGVARELLGDRELANAIRAAIARVERDADVRLGGEVRYATHPEIAGPGGGAPLVRGVDYDDIADPHAWVPGLHSWPFGTWTLAHHPIKRLDRVRAFLGNVPIYEFPTGWFTVNHATGQVNMNPSTAGSAEGVAEQVQVAYAIDALSVRRGPYPDRYPDFWAFDYTATSLSDGRHAELIRQHVGWMATALVLGKAAVKANKLGVTSQSASKDGVSRSFGTSDSQPGGRFARLLGLDDFKEWTSRDALDRLGVRLRAIRVL